MAEGFDELRAIAKGIGRRLEPGESIGVALPPKDRRPVDPVTKTVLSDFATKKWIRRANEGMFPAVQVNRPIAHPVTLKTNSSNIGDGRPLTVPGFLHRKPIPQY